VSRNGLTPGHSRAATSPATEEMKPSSRTGTRRDAAPSAAPASPAISKPPSRASTSRGSVGSGRFTSSARRTASTLRRKPESSTPVPRPVACSGLSPVKAQVSALAAVVLPIPISPRASSVTPESASSWARRVPTSSASSATSRRIAGPWVKSSVPGPMLWTRTPASPFTGKRTPMSTTSTRAPA